MKMSAPTRRTQPSKKGEEGYVLVAVIFMLAVFTIALAVALPRVSKQIQRDRELETMHRGKQYARAVKLYYKKFGAYPPTVNALVKTNNIRFLRKKYTDPMTGKDDWKPIHFGQNKAPTAMGFFGQPLGGSTVAGIGPSGGNGLAGGSSFPQQTDTTGSNAAQAQDASSLNAGTAAAGSTIGSTTGSATGSSFGSSFGSTTGSTAGSSGQTFGGAGIIGFSPGSSKQSIMVYKKKNHYNEWEFVYDPLADQMMQGGNTGTIGQSASTMSGSSAIGSSSFGSSSSTGSTSSSTPSTTQQQ